MRSLAGGLLLLGLACCAAAVTGPSARAFVVNGEPQLEAGYQPSTQIRWPAQAAALVAERMQLEGPSLFDAPCQLHSFLAGAACRQDVPL
jgi:hypothetical protein